MLLFLLAQSLFTPLQGDLCFFRIPLPAIPWMCLAGFYLFEEDNGVTMFLVCNGTA